MKQLLLNPGITKGSAPQHLHFLGYSACVFKHNFKDGIDKVSNNYFKSSGIKLNCHIPVGCGNDDQYDSVWKARNIDNLPDVIASLGFGDFFRKDFVDRFVDIKYFKSIWTAPLNRIFEVAGFRDPNEAYTVYAVMPHVMLIDKRKLGHIPVPRKWGDLLDPQYKGKIALNGTNNKWRRHLFCIFIRNTGRKDYLDWQQM